LSPVGDFTDVDQRLSDAMRAFWVQFAATGDPNRVDLPLWTAFDEASDAHLELGADVVSGQALHVDGADLWDAFQAHLREPR